MIITLLIVLYSLFIAFTVWGLTVNNRTCEDRMYLVEKIFKQPNWRSLSADFGRVDYRQHFWARFFFSDYKKLYSKELQQL